MLSRTSHEEVVRRLNESLGYPMDERNLTAATRQAIANLALVYHHLIVITEILRGEQRRIDQSVVLTVASKVHKDKERVSHTAEVSKLQEEIASKISEISEQIAKEDEARRSGQPPPTRVGGIETVQLKCPSCSAELPMPTGRFVKCQYCGATVAVTDVVPQIKDLIRSI
jgi:DNA-directed RNA polymerase subunit RPC12/RpoP